MAANGCRNFLKRAGIQVGLYIRRSFESKVPFRTKRTSPRYPLLFMWSLAHARYVQYFSFRSKLSWLLHAIVYETDKGALTS